MLHIKIVIKNKRKWHVVGHHSHQLHHPTGFSVTCSRGACDDDLIGAVLTDDGWAVAKWLWLVLDPLFDPEVEEFYQSILTFENCSSQLTRSHYPHCHLNLGCCSASLICVSHCQSIYKICLLSQRNCDMIDHKKKKKCARN